MESIDAAFLPPGTNAPCMDHLRSNNAKVQNQAWEMAWPILWACALGRLRQAWQRGLWDKLDLESCAAEAIRSLSLEVAGQQPATAGLGTFPQLINAATRRAWQRSVDMWRHQGRPAAVPFDGIPPHEPECLSAPGALLHDLTAVLECIRVWPQPRRSIFLLTYIDGMNSREVGEALQLTDTNVRTHLFRGREELWLRFPGMFETGPATRSPATPDTAAAAVENSTPNFAIPAILITTAGWLFLLFSSPIV